MGTGQPVNGETYVPAPGTGHDDVHLLSESVNLASGTVSIAVQQPLRAPGRRFSLPQSYNWLGTPLYHVGLSPVANVVDLEQSLFATSGPYVTWSEATFVPPQNPAPNAPQQVQCNFATSFTFTDRFGVSHNLALGVVAKAVNYPANGPCLMGQNAFPPTGVDAGDGQVWASWISASASATEVGNWNYSPGSTPYGGVGGFNITDKDGVTYTFSGDCQLQIQPGLCGETGGLEDRNGNYPTGTIGDLAIPSPTTVQTTTTNYSVSYQQVLNPNDSSVGETIIGPGPGTGFTANLTATVPGLVEVSMPSGPNSPPPYKLYYGNYNPTDSTITNPYGLINEVVYPGGGWIKYTWMMSNDFRELSTFTGVGQATKTVYTGAYTWRYKLPVVSERQVSYDGVHVAETQTFTYSTTWPSDWQTGDNWTSKTTQVLTADNVRNTSYLTVYTYTPYPTPGSSLAWGAVSGEIPLEQTVQYYAGSTTSTELPRTVTKQWYDQFNLAEEDTTLENGQTSKIVYTYTGGKNDCLPGISGLSCSAPASAAFPIRLQEKDEYDYGATSPTRTTKYQYQIFSPNLSPPSGGAVPIPPKPSSIQTFNSSGSEVAETDYSYDEFQLYDTGAIYMHDDNSYSASMSDRGNPTTIRKKCFVGSTSCTDSVTTLTYDKAGQVMTVTDPCGNTSCSDVSGANHTTKYSRSDNYTCLSGGQNVGCNAPGFTDDYITSITDPLGHISTFFYDYYSGELTSSTDPNGLTTRYTYNDALRRLTETDYDFDGGQSTISYNDAGPNPSATTCKKLTGSQTDCSTATTDGMGQVIETVLTGDPKGSDYTITVYDGLGRAYESYNPTRCAPPAGPSPWNLPTNCGESTWGYKTTTYDALGRTTLVTDQDGQQVTTAYNGNQTTVTDEAQHTRSSFTDALGRLLEVDEPIINGDASSGTGTITISGSPQSYTFNPCANNQYPAPTYCPQTIWNIATFTVTINDQAVTSGCGGSGNTTATCATAMAQAINSNSTYASATASGGTVSLSAKTEGQSSNYSLSVTYNWNTTYFSGPAFTATASGSSLTGGSGPGALYTYDALDDLLSVTQEGGSSDQTRWRVRTFQYDSLGRLISSTNPESNTNPSTGATVPTTYVYDASGNVASKTDARVITTNYLYDEDNRVIQKSYANDPSNTPTVSYGYDGVAGPNNCAPTVTGGNASVGKRTSMCDAAGQESWAYSTYSGGTKTVENRTSNGINKTTTYTYDLAGDLATLTYPFGRVVTYAVDNSARLVSAADSSATYASAAAYTPWGAPCSLAYNSAAITETDTYSYRLQPAEMQATTGGSGTQCVISQTGSLFDLTYGFVDTNGHNNGDVIKITNNRDATRSQVFTYDALNRLSTAGTANTSGSNCWDEQYTYDAWANVTSLSPVPGYSTSCASEGSFTYTVNAANRVTSSGTASFQYDASGNLTDTSTYGYNAESELTATVGGVSYVYDGDGNRIEKLANGSVSKIYWYGSGSAVLDETDGTGSTTNSNFSEYIFFGSTRIARRDSNGNVLYYVDDHLGSSRVLVQGGQSSFCYDADFYPYGGEIARTNTCSQNYKFTGKERDSETGLDNFGARYYNSSSQISFAPYFRFMTADWSAIPVAVPYANLTNPQTLNLYAIVSDNPETFADLDGHAPEPGGGCHSTQYGINHNHPQAQNCNVGGSSISAMSGSGSTGASLTASEMAAAAAQQAQQQHRSFFGRIFGRIGGWLGAAATPFIRWGRLGGPAHRAAINRVEARLQEEGYTVSREVKIDTPEGAKSSRWVDVVGEKDGERVFYQVGRQNLNGTPVAREVQAMNDIERATGIRPNFVPYNEIPSPVQIELPTDVPEFPIDPDIIP